MTLASMTGFARAEGALGEWTWAVEARSVNGRNLEVRFRGPPGFDGLDRLAREAAQSRFQRGQVNMALQAKRSPDGRGARINVAVLEYYLDFGESYVASGRVGAPPLNGLLTLPGVIEPAESDGDAPYPSAVEAAMAASIFQALDGLKAARDSEGQSIAVLLAGFLDRIEVLTTAAEAEAALQPTLIKARFERRLAELAGEAVGHDRIAQEAAAMAVKADVREEIDRLVGHLAAARILMSQTGAIGRRLDFLNQEFMREANTLCAKSAAAKLTAIGLDLKATIDQFREQVQNVE